MTKAKPLPDLTVAECCARLRVTPPTIYRLLASGELDSYTIGRARRIKAESVERLRQHGAAPAPKPAKVAS